MMALGESNTAGTRIAEVVVHPGYRSNGLGQLSVKAALEWIKERRIPEMRKHIVETIAQIARYDPFFEKVASSSSGDLKWKTRVILSAERRGQDLKAPKDGKLWRPSYGKVEPLKGL